MLTLTQACDYWRKPDRLPKSNSHGSSHVAVLICALSKCCPVRWFYFSSANKKKNA